MDTIWSAIWREAISLIQRLFSPWSLLFINQLLYPVFSTLLDFCTWLFLCAFDFTPIPATFSSFDLFQSRGSWQNKYKILSKVYVLYITSQCRSTRRYTRNGEFCRLSEIATPVCNDWKCTCGRLDLSHRCWRRSAWGGMSFAWHLLPFPMPSNR